MSRFFFLLRTRDICQKKKIVNIQLFNRTLIVTFEKLDLFFLHCRLTQMCLFLKSMLSDAIFCFNVFFPAQRLNIGIKKSDWLQFCLKGVGKPVSLTQIQLGL